MVEAFYVMLAIHDQSLQWNILMWDIISNH